MSMVINPYSFAPPPYLGFASAKGSGNIGVSSPMSWNQEHYDGLNAYNSGQPTRLTVQNACLARISSQRFSTSQIGQLQHQKNGASFDGMGRSRSRTNVNFTGTAISSAPVVLAANDYLTTNQLEGTGDAGSTWHGVEVIDSAFQGALVNRSSNQAYSAATMTTVQWNQEVYDTGGYHDNSTNPSRFTIPANGVYRISCNILVNASTYAWGRMKVNGTVIVGCPQTSHDLDCDYINLVSAPLVLTAGDYVEVEIQTNLAGNIGAGNDTWFAIEKVDPSIKRCLIYGTGAQNVTTANPFINFNTEAYDTAAMFDSAVNAQRIYVPAGCTQARITMNLGCAWNGGKIEPSVNFSAAGSGSVIATSHSHFVNACGIWVPATPGEYIAARFYAVNTRAYQNDQTSWICLEAR